MFCRPKSLSGFIGMLSMVKHSHIEHLNAAINVFHVCLNEKKTDSLSELSRLCVIELDLDPDSFQNLLIM